MDLQSQTTTTRTGRIEFIDALRGFTMILVVLQHVASFSWHVYGHVTSVHDYLIQFRMPMFFFISGFVMFKAGVIWDSEQIIKFFRKKIPVQLIAPFLFFALFVYSIGDNLLDSSCSALKRGYWFTFVLFEYYVFYAGIRFIIRKSWASIVLILLGLLLYLISHMSLPIPKNIAGFLSIIKWQYFFFFVLGTIVKEHYPRVETLLDGKWLLPICIVFFFLVNGFREIFPDNPAINLLIAFSLSFTGLIILFSFFRKYQASFVKEKVLGRSLQYIGRRTLDIYLIHYFLVPYHLKISFFVDHPMPIIEATASLIVALLIIGACLLISNVIRLSPLLAHWLFGAKYQSNK